MLYLYNIYEKITYLIKLYRVLWYIFQNLIYLLTIFSSRYNSCAINDGSMFNN